MLSFTEARASSRHGSRRNGSAARATRSAWALLGVLASSAALACSEDSNDPAGAAGSGTPGSGGSAGQTAAAGSGGSSTAGSSSGGTGGSGAAGTSGSGGAGPAADPLLAYDFAEDIEDWYFAYADPATLIPPPPPEGDAGVAPPVPVGVATAAHDSAGDPTGNAGSIRLELPFSGPSQKISYEVGVAMGDTGVNLAARSIRIRISVLSGYSADPMNPPGLKIYAKTGATSLYADSGYMNIAPGADWQTFTWANVSSPAYVDPNGTYEPTDVRQIGVELDTGSAGAYSAATVLLDSVEVY